MIKRLTSILLTVCIVLTLLPMPVSSAGTMTGEITVSETKQRVWGEPGLYWAKHTEGKAFIPFRMSPGGDITGNIPAGTNLEVLAFEGDWAKVKYRDYLCYVWAENLQLIHYPDILVSPWAKDWLSLDGSYYGIAGKEQGHEDWTKTITYADMAILFFDMMIEIYSEYMVRYTSFGIGDEKGWKEEWIPADASSSTRYAINRFYRWDIANKKLDWSAEITYEQFTTYLINLIKYCRHGDPTLPALTQTIIQSFNMGGDTREKSIITKEQGVILLQKAFLWLNSNETLNSGKYSQKNNLDDKGSQSIGNGVYTIRTQLGKKTNQPHIIINNEGKGELSNTTSQHFKVTFKKTVMSVDGYTSVPLFTIQTMDGKYLAISGVPVNGNRLITQNTAYLWYIQARGSHDYQWLQIIRPYDNLFQPLNASAWQTTDGTPIITWSSVDKEPDDNYWFIFNYVGEGSDIPAVPKPTTPPANKDTATPSKTNFVMNGKPVSVAAAYTISGTNYLQLRAIAAMLTGTDAQFDVGWDGQYAVIEPGKPYSGTVSETKLQQTTNIRKSETKFKLNDEVFTFADARLIDGDTNYLQLREFAQKLSGSASQFNLYWDAAANQAVIQPGEVYTGVAQ